MITIQYYINKIKDNKIKAILILLIVILLICSPMIVSTISNISNNVSKAQKLNTRPDDVSKLTYEHAISAIEVADDYVSGKIDGDTAKEKLLNIELLINEEEGYSGDSSVVSVFTLLKYSIESHIRGGGTYQDIEEHRNLLAKNINYSEEEY